MKTHDYAIHVWFKKKKKKIHVWFKKKKKTGMEATFYP